MQRKATWLSNALPTQRERLMGLGPLRFGVNLYWDRARGSLPFQIPPFPAFPPHSLPVPFPGGSPAPQTHPLEKKKKFISRVMTGARRPPSLRTWGRGRKQAGIALSIGQGGKS